MLSLYSKELFEKNKTIPNAVKDAERFSKLHSWYKHLVEPTSAYPILLKGEEPAYSWFPDFEDPNQENFHWRFILEYYLDTYKMDLGEEYKCIPDEIQNFMKKFPIKLNNNFGDGSIDHDHQIEECKEMANKFWNELKNSIQQ